jgi:hypothetical protein
MIHAPTSKGITFYLKIDLPCSQALLKPNLILLSQRSAHEDHDKKGKKELGTLEFEIGLIVTCFF